ncbi:MAG TPA: hypothetical protein VK501_14830 [Baekduia sp.]|uniref:hypothetical protein n=1 Tax=Baekduia sp. TaxID=2600305 RepID=UPI002D027F17|nr:hypothetical protein [Baekduia sp.]HMJ35183.1 hypothetical protein [Baekduia sp.]
MKDIIMRRSIHVPSGVRLHRRRHGLHDETGQFGGAGDGSFHVVYTFPVHCN